MVATTRASARRARPSEKVMAVVLLPRNRERARASTREEARARVEQLALALTLTQTRMLEWRAVSAGAVDDSERYCAREKEMLAMRDLFGAYDDLRHARGVLQELEAAEQPTAPQTPPV
jgi:hypothetical protein